METRLVGIGFAGALLLVARSAAAVAVAVTNAGFEDPLLADNESTDDAIPGWTGSGGVLADNNFGAFDPPTTFFPAEAPEGENVAYIQDGTIGQELAEALQPGSYTLSVRVGQSLVDATSPFSVQLRAAGILLNEATAPVAAAGEFAEVVVTANVDSNHGSLGYPIAIVLVDAGQPGVFADEPYFDDVRLEFEPPGCAGAPVEGCIAASKSSLSVQEGRPGKEKLAAKLGGFATETTQPDFGDPVAGATRYDVCVYDEKGQLVGAIGVDRAGQTCGAKPCWKDKSGKGWSYKDGLAQASGVRALAATGGPSGKGKLKLKAGNNAAKGQTALPTGLAAALQGASSARIQLLASDALCFEAVLATVSAADGAKFKAKAP